MTDFAEQLLAARSQVYGPQPFETAKSADEGGCGVTGFACTVPVGGRFIYEPSIQMQNRGNGKGGGIAAVGLVPEEMGVSADVLSSHYLVQIALLDDSAHGELERQFILPHFDVALSARIAHIDDYRDLSPSLPVRPPDVHRYFVRVKPAVLKEFARTTGLENMPARELEDEFVWRNSYRLNDTFYASLGEKRAFVLCHGRDLMVFKIVGYAEQNVQYYQLQDTRAHVWIAHQRYPTRGRVWHPGGAHPFVGLNEALVHNGDFANYHSVCEYLKQRNIRQQFLTDTEVAVQLFDLWDRVYKYPLEYIVEALAPTTELDFDQLPAAKQAIYRQIQATHIHASPDGPWFFIIARSLPDRKQFQLLGITDTAMLRPQVFALAGQPGDEVQIGLICSEKQAIDATLRSLAREDARFSPVADRYWNARGGSHTDGGTFVFTVGEDSAGRKTLACADKFGRPVVIQAGSIRCDGAEVPNAKCQVPNEKDIRQVREDSSSLGTWHSALGTSSASAIADHVRKNLPAWPAGGLRQFCDGLVARADQPRAFSAAVEALTLVHDRPFDTGEKRASSVLRVLEDALEKLFDTAPLFGSCPKTAVKGGCATGGVSAPGANAGTRTLADKPPVAHDSVWKQPLSQTVSGAGFARRIDWATRDRLVGPVGGEELLVIDAEKFPPEGDACDATLLREAYHKGWRKFAVYRLRGQRFAGVGLGPDTADVRIDVYGSSGDYLASGIDGLEICVHGNAQDQVAQILKRGKLVIYGDVGQTFMYGAKGGEVFVLGNAAGRPLINAVGRPRVVINGTCLDFLAESFMAGDPVNGGGFVILNGIAFDGHGQMVEQATPYPGSNLFSLASGGAIYIRDPHNKVVAGQLNGGVFSPLTGPDWRLIRNYLEENERLFGVRVADLLTVDGQQRDPAEVYRKVSAVKLQVLAAATEKKK